MDSVTHWFLQKSFFCFVLIFWGLESLLLSADICQCLSLPTCWLIKNEQGGGAEEAQMTETHQSRGVKSPQPYVALFTFYLRNICAVPTNMHIPFIIRCLNMILIPTNDQNMQSVWFLHVLGTFFSIFSPWAIKSPILLIFRNQSFRHTCLSHFTNHIFT